jgi:hypothetical protein
MLTDMSPGQETRARCLSLPGLPNESRAAGFIALAHPEKGWQTETLFTDEGSKSSRPCIILGRRASVEDVTHNCREPSQFMARDVTDPHRFWVWGVEAINASGKNPKHISMYTRHKSRITLKSGMSHAEGQSSYRVGS